MCHVHLLVDLLCLHVLCLHMLLRHVHPLPVVLGLDVFLILPLEGGDRHVILLWNAFLPVAILEAAQLPFLLG